MRHTTAGLGVLALVAPLALAPAVMPSAGAAPAASSHSCRAASPLIKKKPKTTKLPDKATLRVWDTGDTPDPYDAIRIAVVTVPHGAKLYGHALESGHLTTTHPLSTLVAHESHAIAGVNGSVFDFQGNQLPNGPEVLAGAVLKASARHEHVLATTKSGRTEFVNVHVTGTAILDGTSVPVTGVNDNRVDPSGVNIYTTRWGSGDRPAGAVDVVVTGGKVTAIRTGRKLGQAPAAGTMILTATGSMGTKLAALKVGQPVTDKTGVVAGPLSQGDPIAAASDPIRSAIGFSSRLVHNGVTSKTLCDSDYNETLRPRTTFGYTAKGDLLIMTISGRAGYGIYRAGGATVHQTAVYMNDLGAKNTILVDGGNSTTLLTRTSLTKSFTREDRTDKGYQRDIPDGYAFETTKP